MKRLAVSLLLASCGGAPFTLADNFDAQAPITTEDPTDATPPKESEQAAAVGIANLPDFPDAQSVDRDSGSARGSARGVADVLSSSSDTSSDAGPDAATIADAGTEEAAQAKPSGMEASVTEACPPPPVAPDGFSNICATAPTRGSSIIQTFPGECACNWTCECLMTSSVCQGLGTPSSCQVVNGPTCNSVVVAVVICK